MNDLGHTVCHEEVSESASVGPGRSETPEVQIRYIEQRVQIAHRVTVSTVRMVTIRGQSELPQVLLITVVLLAGSSGTASLQC